MIESVIKEGGGVRFPSFNYERHYMVPFMQSEGLPASLSHWQETVDDMLDGIKSHEPIYFMADQAYVHAGLPHRRPGVHVDGYWVPAIHAHGGGGGHLGYGGHGGHRGIGTHRGMGRHALADKHEYPHWGLIDFSEPEAMILASDVAGAKAWTGYYDESLIGDGGQADQVPVELLAALDLQAGRAYHGTVSTLHASVPLREDSYRSMVRLNCPGVVIGD